MKNDIYRLIPQRCNLWLFLCLLIVMGTGIRSAAQITVTGATGLAATYPSFTNTGGFFEAINGTIQTGNAIVVTVTADILTEAGTNGLTQGSWTSLTINPAGARTVSGAPVAGTPLFNLNGADNVTIDGLNTGGNSLTLANTTVGATAGTSTIRFIADATSNTVTNCTILGSSTSTLATVAGTIVFGPGTTTGNDNNTISANNIGPAGTDLPSKAVMASGTSATIENDSIQITNNNIFDFFLTTASTTGINVLAGNEAWMISDNKFYQTAPRVFTAIASRYAGITWNNASGIASITGNTIGFGATDGTGITTISGSTNEFRGIVIENAPVALPFVSIQGNTIAGINQTTGRNVTTTSLNPFIGIQSGSSATDGPAFIGNITGNTIGSVTGTSSIVVNASSVVANTAPVVGILDFNFVGNVIVSNNSVGSITINNVAGTGTTTGFRGIQVSSTAGVTHTLNNNIIGGTAPGSITDNIIGAYAMNGILDANATIIATGNTVRNMTGSSNTASAVIMTGISVSGTTGANNISQNTFHSFLNNSGSAFNVIYTMSLTLPATANVIDGNFIHSMSIVGTNVTCQLWGINAGTTGTATYRNNIIRLGIDASGASITSPFSIVGIRESAGAIANNYFHNSVYIGGSGVLPAGSNTYAFNSTVVTNTRSVLNNVFYNARGNATGGGIVHVAMGIATTTTGLTSDYNDLYVSGTDGVVGVFNSTIYPTLPAYRTATGKETNSLSVNPQYIAPNGTAATVNLHIAASPTVTNPLESAGTTTSVALDYDGDARPGPAGSVNGGATAPDLGADEFDGTPCSAVEVNIQGNAANVVDGQTVPSATNGTDFGTLAVGPTLAKTFTIQNTGTKTLSVTGSSITGTNAADFAVSGMPASVAGGGSATFTVTFTPSANGTRTAVIHIANTDCDEADYDFAVQACAPALAMTAQNISQDVADNSFEATGCVDLIANVAPSGGTPVSGSVTANVYFNTPGTSVFNGEPYVDRFYDITPAAGASAATATVTLYFTQTEFDNYNAAMAGTANDLPTGPADMAGIANLRVTEEHGTSATGLPGTYSGTSVLINPADANIVWNTVNSRWEVTFDVNGFSGFYVTGNISVPLPLQLLSFKGKTENGYAMLEWQSANEQNMRAYTIERSSDSRSFRTIGTQAAKNSAGTTSYSFRDAEALGTRTYYRLKMEELNSSSAYSQVLILRGNGAEAAMIIYPNPVRSGAALQVSGATGVQSWKLINSLGQVVRSGNADNASQISIPTNGLSLGVYRLVLVMEESTGSYPVAIQ